MFIRKLNWIIFSVGIISFCFIILGCATAPYVPPSAPTIRINTVPSGADISIQGNYIGKSPLVINAPYNYQGNEPMIIEAILEGYELRTVKFGDYHPETSELRRNILDMPVAGYPAKITPAYYTFRNEINIKLQPKK